MVPLAEKPGWEPRVWSRIAEEIAQGRQAFVVCPAIDATGQPEDDDDDNIDTDGAGLDDGTPARQIASVSATLERLASMPVLAGARIRGLHGRLATDEKDEIMRAFAAGEIDVLVSTTVIEVGVDVPNASVMAVLDADRFGVSQLHQLRGRVGRGSVPGIALFVTAATVDSLARERVDAVAATTDGFELAERDLSMRHEGDVLGATQSGRRSSLRLLSAATDGDLIARAREDAIRIVAIDPDLITHPALADAIARRLDASSEAFLTRS